MPKQGILHDYDLQANSEACARGNVCVVCDADPVVYQWSDYHGEAMCTRCGTPYQLRAGSEKMEKEAAYPYLNLTDKWVPIIREYYAETERFTYLGIGIGPKPGMSEFVAWVKANHPEMTNAD